LYWCFESVTISSEQTMPNPTATLDLEELHGNNETFTAYYCGLLEEASILRLEEQGHQSGVAMEVDGTYSQTFRVIWGYTTNDGMRRCYQDEEQTTEWAACGIALMLIQKLTDYAPISRSRKGTGFDYWLGTHQDTDDNIFLNKARLEVSGIRKGSDTQINRRLREKIDQPNPSNSTLLSVYAVVVEFSRPTSRIAQR
jgi:hypothetical protein